MKRLICFLAYHIWYREYTGYAATDENIHYRHKTVKDKKQHRITTHIFRCAFCDKRDVTVYELADDTFTFIRGRSNR